MDPIVLRFAGGGRPGKHAPRDLLGFRIVQRWGVAAVPVRDRPEFVPGMPLEGILMVKSPVVV